MKKLTIAIPTYNREEIILSKVEEICKEIENSKLSKNVDLLVLDNATSDYNIFKLLEKFSYHDFLQIHRNEVNVGANANFLRCIEFAKGEFVWLLGDDEQLNIKKLSELLDSLGNKDCYFLPRDEEYVNKAKFFGEIRSIDELFENFWNLPHFFALSIYIFKTKVAIKYLKEGYETLVYQHPYSAIALSMLNDYKEMEVLSIAIIKTQEIEYKNIRYDLINANIDVANTVWLYTTNKQFKKYLKKDFYPARTFFLFPKLSKHYLLKRKFNLEKLIRNYNRLMMMLPKFSYLKLRCKIRIWFLQFRKKNSFFALEFFLLSRFNKKNKYHGWKFKHIVKDLKSRIHFNENLRH
jgi:glycosyltransferase involved in cell wall biosynthesis